MTVKNQYRREMDQLLPREEKLEELYTIMEGETNMKHVKGFTRRAIAAALVCLVLTVTATAAAVPAIRETIMSHLGAFAPYAQTVQGASCQDQGIKVQVLSALSDDLQARFYLSVQDLEGDRMNQHLTLEGKLENSIDVPSEQNSLIQAFSRNNNFELISYDEETKTALFSIYVRYFEGTRPTQDAHLSLTSMTTRQAVADRTFPLASTTGEVLKSLPIGETERTILTPSDIINFGYTDAILPSKTVVLAPELNHVPLEGTDDMWISSMGFASDGCFHIRLGFAEGVSVLNDWFHCALELDGVDSKKGMAVRETLVPDGIDLLYPLFHEEDLGLLQNGNAALYGNYTRPGTEIEGAWDIDFQVEYFSSTVLDWTGDLAGRQIKKVTLSPLTVTMNSNDSGEFGTTALYAIKQDGSTVSAKPSAGTYSNAAYATGASEPVWNAYNTWVLDEPVDTKEIVALSLMGEVIPVN